MDRKQQRASVCFPFCHKTEAVLPQNALRFATKRKSFCHKTQNEGKVQGMTMGGYGITNSYLVLGNLVVSGELTTFACGTNNQTAISRNGTEHNNNNE